MPLVLKMAKPQQRSWCVLQLAKKEFVTAVQDAFRIQFHMEPPNRVSIYAWYKKFEQKGCICKNKSPGWPSVSDATVDHVQACFQCNPQKSMRRASRELQLQQTSPKSCVSIYLWNHTNFNWSRLWNQKIRPIIVLTSAVWLAEPISSLCVVCKKLWEFFINWCRC
jgi:hypothetical protein